MRFPRSSRAGFTLVEMTVALAIAGVVLGGIAVTMQREAKGLSEMASRTASERGAAEMLGKIERQLEFAIGATPTAFVTEKASPGNETGFAVDNTMGFPASGMLLLQPGTQNEERIAYAELKPTTDRFEQLVRGIQCGTKEFHDLGTLVRWAPMAVPIEEQVNPAQKDFDGVAAKSGEMIYFRGDGTGFSFRAPTDPNGNGEFYVNGEIIWGATIGDTPSLDGWSCLYYQPVDTLLEDEAGDINGDGDRDDVFDMGRVRMMSWNCAVDSSPVSDISLCAPIVVQERCNWGGDLNADGYDDPMFLWDADTGRLHVTLFVAGAAINGRVIARPLETTLYLRNGAMN